MAEEKVRVRLVFEDRSVLSKPQKKEGLSRSWVALNVQHQRTISDISALLLDNFDLFDTCPHGLTLSMDGFVLPPFESSCILKDTDIVCVKKKKGPSLEITRANDSGNDWDTIKFEERQHPCPNPHQKLLANEEFGKETGGYESDSEEDEPANVQAQSPKKKASTSRKRKAASKSPSSKRKKCKLATGEERVKEDKNGVSVGKSKKFHCVAVDTRKHPIKKGKLYDVGRELEKSWMTEVDEENNDPDESTIDSKRSLQQEEANGAEDLCQKSGETKKTPSRSARRKKAKRQWLREKAKLEKQELQQKQLIVTHNQKSISIANHHVAEEHQDDAEEHQDDAEDHQQSDEPSDDAGDEVFPVEVRPGHFRFKPLGKVGSDETDQESQSLKETFVWNGIMSKKKGQKWGMEKTAPVKQYDQNFSQVLSQYQTTEAETLATGQSDYEKLMPYVGCPKEGDVFAYRLIELSSSWTPEISSFRVGKITRYDAESKKVTLMPVPGFPIEKKMVEDDTSFQPNTSHYKEDGSLEIEFSSLLDVRGFDDGNSNAARPVTAEVDEIVREPDQTSENVKPGANNELQAPVEANGTVKAWEELIQAASAKKAELSRENGWNKKENSSRGLSSYKGLSRNGLGPVMNYLRSQKEL